MLKRIGKTLSKEEERKFQVKKKNHHFLLTQCNHVYQFVPVIYQFK